MTLDAAPQVSSGSGRGDNRGGQDRIYAVPGRAGDLWLPAYDGLYHMASPMAADAGDENIEFARLAGVDEIYAFGFGKGAPGHSYPAIYLAGTVNNQPGVFRSIDEARTWTRINDDQHQWGLILQITGDPRSLEGYMLALMAAASSMENLRRGRLRIHNRVWPRSGSLGLAC